MSKPIIYFSSLLQERHPELFADIVERFSKHNQRYGILDHTGDIWCRDYMPICGTDGTPVQFQYRPSYLEDYPNDRTDPKEAIHRLPIDPITSELKLDGGNIIHHNGTAIVSERVFKENTTWHKSDVEKELIEKLKLERMIFVEDEDKRYDMTGHVDGMCRFIDDQKILLNDFHPNETLGKNIKMQLEKAGFEVISLEVDPAFYSQDRNWVPAINFLETDDVLYLPVTTTDSPYEEAVIQQIEELFPEHTIEPINVSTITQVRYNSRVEDGGALNCISWELKA